MEKFIFRIFFYILLVALTIFSSDLQAQRNSLRDKIEAIIPSAKGTVGVAIKGWTDKDTLTFMGHGHFPMQSVYKFHLALTVLHLIDKGQFSLNDKIHIDKKDLLPDTWSPLRDKYPEGNVDIALADVLRFTVSQSDNNGCDILFRRVGGPAAVEKYIHSLGVKEVAVNTTEQEMHKDAEIQFTNWSEPLAIVQLLELFDKGNILSKASTGLLWKMMAETTTGPNRIKATLPAGTIVAHRTGLSDTNDKGITAATNDIGIVALPNGKHFFVVVFVSGSIASEKVREGVIARIAKEAWDYFNSK